MKSPSPVTSSRPSSPFEHRRVSAVFTNATPLGATRTLVSQMLPPDETGRCTTPNVRV